MEKRNKFVTYRTGKRRFVSAGERGRRGRPDHQLVFSELGGMHTVISLRTEQAKQLFVTEWSIGE